MKKIKFFSFALLAAALSLGFVACSDDDDNQQTTSNAIANISNASYVAGNIPAVTTTESVATANCNTSALAGGANIVTVSSAKELTKLYVAVEGQNGYYEVVPTPVSRSEASTYVYEFTVNYDTGLTESFTLVVNALTSDNEVVSVLNQEIEYVESQYVEKALAINLTFDQLKDVDLHLFYPNDSIHIYYGNRGSNNVDQQLEQEYSARLEEYIRRNNLPEDEGQWTAEQIIAYRDFVESLQREFEERMKNTYSGLDHDSNAGCTIDSLNNENIVISGENLIPGTYKVYVNMYSNCSPWENATNWTSIIRINGEPVAAIEGANPASGTFARDAESNSGDIVEKMTLATTFTLTQAQIDRAKSANRVRSNRTRRIEAPMTEPSLLKTLDNNNLLKIWRSRH